MITAKKLNSRLSKDISHMIVDHLSILDDDDDDEVASQQRKDLSLLSKMVIFSRCVTADIRHMVGACASERILAFFWQHPENLRFQRVLGVCRSCEQDFVRTS